MRTHHPITLLTRAVLLPGLLSVGIAVATTAQAGNQLFEASWTVKAQGNERTGGTGESEFYSAFGMPAGNPVQPEPAALPVRVDADGWLWRNFARSRQA